MSAASTSCQRCGRPAVESMHPCRWTAGPDACNSDFALHDYFFLVHAQSVAGADTSAAALHILDRVDFSVYVPQHALRLRREQTLVYLLLTADQAKWLPSATQKFQTGTEQQQIDLLSLFYYAQTPECDALLRAASRQTGLVQKAALQFLWDEKNSGGVADRGRGATAVHGDDRRSYTAASTPVCRKR